MNRLLSLSRLLVTTFALSSAAAFAADKTSWYTDIAAGQGHSNLSGSSIDNVLANQGLTPASSYNANRSAWKFDVGYQVNPIFGVEVGYVDLGREQWSSAISAPAADTLSGQLHTRGATFDLVSTADLGEGLTAYGKVGVMRASVDFSGGSIGGGGVPVAGANNKSSSANFALGMGYDFTPNVGTKLEWDRYQGVGDANATGKGNYDLVTAALVFKF